jgi:hypothetical protein
MKNLFGKFAVMASLFILTLTSCKKEEAIKGDENGYTTFEVSNVTLLTAASAKIIKVDGLIGEKLATNNIIPKMTITRTDEKGVPAMIYTYKNVNLTGSNENITITPNGTYGKATNKVYNFSISFPAAALGKGVKGSTTITINVYDATQVISTFNTTNLDYNIKL